jgi:lia operon protein LiaF
MESRSSSGSVVAGTVLIVLGLLFLFDGPSLFDIIRWIFHFWPVALIALGIYLMMGDRHRETRGASKTGMASEQSHAAGRISRDSFLGDLRVKLPAQGFQGGEIKTVVGSVVIDASQLSLEDGEHRLYLHSGVGDVHVDLMPGLPVKVEAQVNLGDIKIFDQKADGVNQVMNYQTPRYEEAPARLLVICKVGLGDIKVF